MEGLFGLLGIAVALIAWCAIGGVLMLIVFAGMKVVKIIDSKPRVQATLLTLGLLSILTGLALFGLSWFELLEVPSIIAISFVIVPFLVFALMAGFRQDETVTRWVCSHCGNDVPFQHWPKSGKLGECPHCHVVLTWPRP